MAPEIILRLNIIKGPRVKDDCFSAAHQMTPNCNQQRKLMFKPKILGAEENEMNPEHPSPQIQPYFSLCIKSRGYNTNVQIKC